tara:strand:- start:5754 stop:6953 length:1200 start_codon:yes stop_codon:yes gene_type:complete
MRFLEGITLDVRQSTQRSLTKHLRVRPCNGASLLFIKIFNTSNGKKLIMVQDKKQNPIQKRRRRGRRKPSKHELDTPTIEISKQGSNGGSGFNQLQKAVISETGNADWNGYKADGSKNDRFEQVNMTPSFEGGLVKGKLGIMNQNRTNINLNVPVGNRINGRNKSGNRPVNVKADFTIAPNSLLRSKPSYVPNNKAVFDPKTGGLTRGSELSSGGKFDKKVTGLNANIGFKQIIPVSGSSNVSQKNNALKNSISLEGGLNLNNLRSKAVKPYAKVSYNASIGTDEIRKLRNKPFSANVGVGGSMSRTFFNKPDVTKDFSVNTRLNPEYLTGSPNSLTNFNFSAGVKHKKSGISLNYTRSHNTSLAASNSDTSLTEYNPSSKTKENKISLKIPLGRIKNR